ncbi:type II toxin-antitoxin system RelE/ParE family toxin [Castellaniella ginsengisoli]|uniref:Type II toxin-antitoxin system RelE/ParE family toxin n=1 Tax=Castellaniella ginsengisoli TaxID=546114 RepID=A0AB39FL16_9BURK
MEFIETPMFTRQILELLPDEDYAELQLALAENPRRGDLIPGGGGIRKIRFRRPGAGKQGGLRVIYYWIAADDQILMLIAYAKTAQENLSSAQIEILRALVKDL